MGIIDTRLYGLLIYVGGHSEVWVEDGEYIVGHALKAITYHHLLL